MTVRVAHMRALPTPSSLHFASDSPSQTLAHPSTPPWLPAPVNSIMVRDVHLPRVRDAPYLQLRPIRESSWLTRELCTSHMRIHLIIHYVRIHSPYRLPRSLSLSPSHYHTSLTANANAIAIASTPHFLCHITGHCPPVVSPREST